MAKVPSVWTVLSMMEWGTSFFEEKKVKSPRFSIEWLLADVLSTKRLDLYLKYDRPLSTAELDELRPMVKRRASHEPLQYITGETDFHRVTLKVEQGVLIPRQETEQLVDWVLNQYDSTTQLRVIDIGTGSGCIPIALKKDRPNWHITATDISVEALRIAKENASLNQVEIDFIQSDLFQTKLPSGNKFDIIISNPPYIHPDEKNFLDEEVKNFEPEIALFCESTQKMYSAIEKICQQYLKPAGTVFLELHENHSDEVFEIFKEENWEPELKNDFSGKPRFLRAKKG